MLTKLLLPPLYLLIGWLFGKSPYDLKHPAALLVNKIVIPCVIIYNLATYQSGMVFIIIGMMVMMGIMLGIGLWISRDPIQSLSISYLNIAWFGLPVASAIMGDDATKLLITLYVGNSLLGNGISPGLLQKEPNLSQRLRTILTSPSFIALLIGFCLIPFQAYVVNYLTGIYQFAKALMSFLGMFILGCWLANVRLDRQGFKQALMPFLVRTLGFLCLAFLFIQVGKWLDIRLIIENQPALYLLALLPPAANIVVLETFYLKTGHSAKHIAYGTCFSFVVIGVYVFSLVYFGWV